jgi:uncharacterized membrane protein
MVMLKKYGSIFKTCFIIAVICLLCEVFVFNARHFVTHWGDGPVDMKNWQVNLNNVVHNDFDGLFSPSGEWAEIEFPGLNRRVVTVYMDIVFINGNQQNFRIAYGNEEHSDRSTAEFTVIKGVEETRYVTLQTYGKVSFVKVIYGSGTTNALIRDIKLNKTVPLKIFWPRLFLFFFTAFGILLIKRKKLYSAVIRHDSLGQNVFSIVLMAVFIAYLFVLMLLTQPFSVKVPFSENFARERRDQYNAYVVDALLSGQAHLLIEPPIELLKLQNPYDHAARLESGVRYLWDTVLFNGKYYSYYGVVQVLILALPYKLVTGKYIPTRVAIFIFSALASIFLMLIWRRLVFRFMKDMPLGMYMLGQLAVAMCSMITFMVNLPYFYSVAGSSAMFFTAFGLWIILGSIWKEKLNLISLAAGCFLMALAVGCRPTFMFASFLVPILLIEDVKKIWYDRKSDRIKQFICLCACVAVPYFSVASGLMWYNYIRFDSVFEFGSYYVLSETFVKNLQLLNPLGKLLKALIGFICYFLSPFGVKGSFPFIYLNRINIDQIFKGYFLNVTTLGLLFLPISWALFGIGAVKKVLNNQRKPVFHLIVAMLSIAFFQIIFLTIYIAIDVRYQLEFFWLFIFPSLLIAYFLCEKAPANFRIPVMKIFNAAMIMSIIIIFLLSWHEYWYNSIWRNNPDVIFYVQRLLGFNTW